MPLLDQYGRPMPAPVRRDMLELVAEPTLGNVRQIIAGHPADGITPDRLASILRAAELGDATQYLEMAEQMEEKDLHYAAVLGVRKRAIRALQLVVEPGDETDAAAEAADQVREALGSAPVKEGLIDMLDAIGKGYSVMEIIWRTKGQRRYEIVDLEHRDPRWFEFDRENGRHLYLRDAKGPQELTPRKFVIHIARAKSGLPIRGGLGRLAAWGYMFKNYALKDWAIFLEAYGHPLRLGKYDTSATPEDRRALLRAVRNIGSDMAAIVPRSMEIDVVSPAGGSSSAGNYEANARYWDQQISKGVLGQVATTDAIAGGHAVGKIHEEVRGDICVADAEQLATTLRRDIAAVLVDLNFPAGVPVPEIRFATPESVDPRLLLQLLRSAPGLPIGKADLYRAFSLRPPEDGEDVINATPAAGSPPRPAPAPEPERARRQTAAVHETPGPDALRGLTDRLAEDGDLEAAMADEYGELMEAISAAGSVDEVRDILATFADTATDEEIRDLLARTTFNARLAGEVGAPIRDDA